MLPQLLRVLACIFRISVCVRHGRKQAIPLFQSRELPQTSKHGSKIVISPNSSATTQEASCLSKRCRFVSASLNLRKSFGELSCYIFYHWKLTLTRLCIKTSILSFVVELPPKNKLKVRHFNYNLSIFLRLLNSLFYTDESLTSSQLIISPL